MAMERSRGKQVSVDAWGFGLALIRLIVLNNMYEKDSTIDFEMCFIVVEAIRGRCASIMILTATVSDICG